MSDKKFIYLVTGGARAQKETCNKESTPADIDEMKMLALNAECQDNFADYFDDKGLIALIKDGTMTFKFDEEKSGLITVTKYTANAELSKEQIETLKDYTQGQWSDGIGEGYEQFACHIDGDDEYYISPWYYGQEIKCELLATKEE
jgi:hypothetical protein